MNEAIMDGVQISSTIRITTNFHVKNEERLEDNVIAMSHLQTRCQLVDDSENVHKI